MKRSVTRTPRGWPDPWNPPLGPEGRRRAAEGCTGVPAWAHMPKPSEPRPPVVYVSYEIGLLDARREMRAHDNSSVGVRVMNWGFDYFDAERRNK